MCTALPAHAVFTKEEATWREHSLLHHPSTRNKNILFRRRDVEQSAGAVEGIHGHYSTYCIPVHKDHSFGFIFPIFGVILHNTQGVHPQVLISQRASHIYSVSESLREINMLDTRL